MKKPYRRAFIEITNHCGLACPFCAPSRRPPLHMDPSLFRRVAAQAGELAEIVSLHLLGEPLAHPAFSELLSDCSALGLKINLVTNGVRLGEYRERLLSEPCLRQVSVSLHALEFLPAGKRAEVLRDILGFTAGKPAGLTVGLRLRAAASSGFFRETLSAVTAAFGAAAEGRYIKLAEKAYLNFGGVFSWPGSGGGRRSCLGLRHHFGVLSDGRVVPCCADYDGALALGSAAELPLAGILGSAAAAELRGRLAGGRAPGFCASCGFSAPDARGGPAGS